MLGPDLRASQPSSQASLVLSVGNVGGPRANRKLESLLPVAGHRHATFSANGCSSSAIVHQSAVHEGKAMERLERGGVVWGWRYRRGRQTAIGAAVGIAAMLESSKVIVSLLYGVHRNDRSTMAGRSYRSRDSLRGAALDPGTPREQACPIAALREERENTRRRARVSLVHARQRVSRR